MKRIVALSAIAAAVAFGPAAHAVGPVDQILKVKVHLNGEGGVCTDNEICEAVCVYGNAVIPHDVCVGE